MVESNLPVKTATSPLPSSHTRLHGAWLWLARAAWCLVVLLIIVMVALGLPLRLADMSTPCIPTECQVLHLSIEGAQTLQKELGITPLGFAIMTTFMESYLTLVFLVSGILITWRKSDDWMALFSSAALIIAAVGLNAFLETLTRQVPLFSIPARFFNSLVYPLLILLFYLFPNGRFTPAWTRWIALLLTGIVAVMAFNNKLFSPTGVPFLVPVFAGGVFSQVHRYRHVSSPAERQQTKWVLFGFTGLFLGITLFALAILVAPVQIDPSGFFIRTVQDFILAVPFAFIFAFVPWSLVPITFAFSMLRYGLWNVDPILNRSMVYSALSGSLVIIYFSSVALLQVIIPSHSQSVVVISTLAIAALFNPLRRYIQNQIDRRFYRQKYDAQKVLAAFSAGLRNEVAQDQVTAEILSVVDKTYHPGHVSLWINKSSQGLKSHAKTPGSQRIIL